MVQGPLICCCSLAGTPACENCITRKNWENRNKNMYSYGKSTGTGHNDVFAVGYQIGKPCRICGTSIVVPSPDMVDHIPEICDKCCKRLKRLLYYEDEE